MKKIILALVIALSFAACNNETTTDTTVTDSVAPGNRDNHLDTMHLHGDTTGMDNMRIDTSR